MVVGGDVTELGVDDDPGARALARLPSRLAGSLRGLLGPRHLLLLLDFQLMYGRLLCLLK